MSSSFLPLNAKQDVRPGTRNPGTFDSTLINSSVIPSLKYSSFLSALMFTNGSTAIDFWSAAFAVLGAAGEVRLLRGRVVHHQPMPMTDSKSNATTVVANLRPLDLDLTFDFAMTGVRCSHGSTMRNKSIGT